MNGAHHIDQIALLDTISQNWVPLLIPRYNPVPLSCLDNIAYAFNKGSEKNDCVGT